MLVMLGMVSLAPPVQAQAGNGFFEGFGTEPPAASWYSFAANPDQWNAVDGVWLRDQTVSGTPREFILTTEIPDNTDYYIEIDYHFQRLNNAPVGDSMSFGIRRDGGTFQVVAEIAFTSTTNLRYSFPTFVATCPNQDNVIPNAAYSTSGTLTMNYDGGTDTFTVGGWGTGCVATNPNIGLEGFRQLSTFTANRAQMVMWWDNLVFNDFTGDTYTVPPDPEPVPGLSATVVEAWDAADGPSAEAHIELVWLLSPTDPDQDVGDYAYDLYLDGISIGTDSTTPADGDGLRFNLVIEGGTLDPGTSSLWIVARDTITGDESIASCSVSVDASVLNDFDTCGENVVGGPGGTDFTTPTDTAAGLLGFCSDLMGDSDGSLFMCGLIFVVAAFLAMAGGFAAITGSTGLGPTIAGSAAGFGMMIFNVFAGIWGIVWAIVLIILVAAIITVVIKKFTGAGAASGE